MDEVTKQRTELPAGVAPGRFVPPLPVDRTPDLVAAALAGGMIAAGGKGVTAEEAMEVWRLVKGALAFPEQNGV